MSSFTWSWSTSPISLFPRCSVVSVCANKWRCVYETDEDRMRVTVLVRNASARCSTPTSPIWLHQRSSVVRVYVKKWRCVYEINEQRMRVTVLFRNASARCCAPTMPIPFWLRFSVMRVGGVATGGARWCNTPLVNGFASLPHLCSLCKNFLATPLTRVCVKKWRCVYEIGEERMRVTVLICNASARCCTPLSPIWLPERFSAVSVCVKKWRCI
jgi:hypothetical protein